MDGWGRGANGWMGQESNFGKKKEKKSYCGSISV